MTIYGELYTYVITPTYFSCYPQWVTMQPVVLESNSDEDFSIFELGPAIVQKIEMMVNDVQIGNEKYNGYCFEVEQKPGKYILLRIRKPRENSSQPLASGEIVWQFKDYVIKYESVDPTPTGEY